MSKRIGTIAAFANRPAVSEVAKHRARQASQDAGLALLIAKAGKPTVEHGRPDKDVHASLLYPFGYKYAITARGQMKSANEQGTGTRQSREIRQP